MIRLPFTPASDTKYSESEGYYNLQVAHKRMPDIAFKPSCMKTFQISGTNWAHLIFDTPDSTELLTIKPYQWNFTYEEGISLDKNKTYYLCQNGYAISILVYKDDQWVFFLGDDRFVGNDEKITDAVRTLCLTIDMEE